MSIVCKKCGSEAIIKSGTTRYSQRYKCKACYSVFCLRSISYINKGLRSEIVKWYLEGASIRGIGRRFSISHTSVIRIIKDIGSNVISILPHRANHIELDELYFFIGSKKVKRYLWIAVCRDTKRILAFQIGRRNKDSFRKLFNKIRNIDCTCYYTDNYRAYKKVLPSSMHVVMPGGTNTIEGINTSIRRYLSRFHRKTVCYTKSQQMVSISMALLMNKLNTQIK